MDEKREYYYGPDFLRVLATAAVLVYHLSPSSLPGGYLAVCSFLVLHGFLFALSEEKRQQFSLGRYLLKRFVRLYLPMAAVTAITVYALRFFPDVIWLNEKPETLSVLGLYNNWWQISVGQDYFARASYSPLVHMWYLSLLIQCDLIMVAGYGVYRLVKRKTKFMTAWLPVVLAGVISLMLPTVLKTEAGSMQFYYGTWTRLSSVLIGLVLGLWRSNNQRSTVPFLKNHSVFIGLLLTAVMTALCLVEWEMEYQLLLFGSMSFLSAAFLYLSTDEDTVLYGKLKLPLLKMISSVSYEIYLIHYPVLFYLGNDPMVIPVTLIMAVILHVGLDFKKISLSKQLLKTALFIPICLLTVLGGRDIWLAEDHTEEMKELERLLAENEELVDELQDDYIKQRQENEKLTDPELLASELDVASLPVTGIGDSVMLGAVSNLRKQFPNGDFDAKKNRTHYPMYNIIKERAADKTLGNPVVIAIGTNGVLKTSLCRTAIELCGERQIYWLTITNNRQFSNNDKIRGFAEEYENVTVLDWEAYSKGHTEYFYADGIHLRPEGRRAYTKFILEGITNDLVRKKLDTIEETEYMFGIGDGHLLAALDTLRTELENTYFQVAENPDYDKLVSEIEKIKEEGVLPKTVFISLGSAQTVGRESLEKLFVSLGDSKIIILKVPGLKNNKTNENIDELLVRYPEIKSVYWDMPYEAHPEYYRPDRIHLNEEGGRQFAAFVAEQLKNTEKE